MKLTLMKKLLAGFLSVIFLLGMVAFVGIKDLGEVTAQYQDLSGRINENIIQARRIDASQLGQSLAVIAYVATGDLQYRQDFDAEERAIKDALNWIADNSSSAEARAYITALEKAEEAYGKLARSILQRTDVSPEEANEVVLALGESRSALNGIVEDLVAYEEREGDQAAAAAERAATRAMSLMISIAAVAAVLGTGTGVFMSRSISRPVAAVAHAAQRVAAGDLTVEELQIKTSDEVGDMARAFNQMVLNLRQLIRGVSASSQSVMAAAEELSAASDQTALAAQGAAQGVGQVASGATEQARSANEVRSTMDELQQTIQQIATGAGQSAAEVQKASDRLGQMANALQTVADNAGGVAEGSERAAQAAKSGADVVKDTVVGMERIKQVVGETAARIQNLDRLSVQIGEITEAISGIADQTNLLALNAAIEAARAGEHGRGFAVVAEEVRRLAERSSSSAKDITGLISSIQVGTAEAVKAMEAGTTEVESGSKRAVEAGRSLQEILVTVEKAAAGVKEIARAVAQVQRDSQEVVRTFDGMAAVTEENTAATEEMAAGTHQVTRAVDRIASSSQENAAATEEVSAAVEEVTASSEEVASSAQSLAKVAQDLQEQVARFRT